MSEKVREVYEKSALLGYAYQPRQGMAATDNKTYLRNWHEISYNNMCLNASSSSDGNSINKNWFPYNKGGNFRKWYGNNEFVINYTNDGLDLLEMVQAKYPKISDPEFVIKNRNFYFKPSITWSFISSSYFGVRLCTKGFIFDVAGSSLFPSEEDKFLIASLLTSKVATYYLNCLNPTLNFQVENVSAIPLHENIYLKHACISQNGEKCTKFARQDWDSYEASWGFTQNPIIRTKQQNLEQAFNTWQQQNADAVAEMKRLEEENNKLFIDAYGLQDELTPDVPDEQITLTRADREKDSQRLVSYALGCMMGRYSLDEPGLIYAHAGNQDFNASRYQTFPADADGIIPLTEMHWFEDDATHRIQEFLTAVWGKETLDANMQWLAESLDKKANETAEDTIRRYLASKFYKDHMQTYKKRPIYWLFSSGKQGAFQALVYLHRYNESTLARMRTEYVMPLISKMAAMVNSLQSEIENSDSAAEIKRKEKELQNLHKQQAELSSFEEKLRHYADQRISLDLDDGVKVNYGKFGDLLAEVKAVTGEK